MEMKRFLTFFLCLTALVGCNNEYDDSGIKGRLDDLDTRLTAVEKRIESMNGEISQIQDILSKAQSGKVITDVVETSTGYDVKMSDGTSIPITNGKDGKDGKDAVAPVIGVKQGTDGIYYWTLNGEFLTKADGKTPLAVTGPKGENGKDGNDGAAGKDGKDGVTPIIGIDADGYWTVNTGDGVKQILVDGKPVSAIGQKGEQGQTGEKGDKGDKGDSFFSKVEKGETQVTFTLSDGSTFSVPMLSADTYLRFADDSDADIYYGYGKTLEIETKGIRSALITAPCGWTASVNLSTSKVKLSAPFFTETDSEFEGYVSIIGVTDDGYTLTASKVVRAGIKTATLNEVSDILSTVIEPRISEETPWNLEFELTEKVANYSTLDIPKTFTRKAVESIKVVMTEGSEICSGGSYDHPYDGAVEIVVPAGQTIKYIGMQLPSGDITLSGSGTVTGTGALKAGGVVTVGENTTIESMAMDRGNIINMGNIKALKISTGKATEILSYGTVGEITESYGTAEILSPRRVSSASSKWISKVTEYLPAPGQNINGGYGTPAVAQGLVGKKTILTLGMFGGYVEFQFDHTVPNFAGTDFVIHGNAFATANEPGAVLVSFDSNGNGLPDDEWYELKGESYDKETTVKNYEIKYIKPDVLAANTAIHWEDNQGGSGDVPARIGWSSSNHWPTWFEGDTLTLRGNKIEVPTMMKYSMGYGYVDTFTPDYNDTVGGDADTRGSNKFDISNAIDSEGNPVSLVGIDFIRVYNAVYAIDSNASFGEISTEVCGAISVNLSRIPRQSSGVSGWTSTTF